MHLLYFNDWIVMLCRMGLVFSEIFTKTDFQRFLGQYIVTYCVCREPACFGVNFELLVRGDDAELDLTSW